MKDYVILGLAAVVAVEFGIQAFRPGPDDTFAEHERHRLELAMDSAQAYARRARDARAAYADSLARVRDSVAAVRAHADTVAREAHARVDSAGGRVRAVLDSLGASASPLDSLLAAHRIEVAAKDDHIAALNRQLNLTSAALEVADSVAAAERARADAAVAERDHYAERWRVERKRREGAERSARVGKVLAAVGVLGALAQAVF